MFDFEQKLKTLPDKPGVYLMYNNDDEIIYVGKAKVLKNRVKQYFKSNNHPPKVSAMISNIARFEYIIADSELEALVLENNLIKKHMPKYNILLKDDKTYPFIKVTINEEFPGIYMTRKVNKDGARYFGPYQSAGQIKELIELIREIFHLRYCNKNFDVNFKITKPCLYYHIGKCKGVCSGKADKEEYRLIINKVCQFLNGKYDYVLKNLNEEMIEAANSLDFEKATIIRDRISSVMQLKNKQKIVTANGIDIDAVSLYNDNDVSCIEIFFIRNGNIIGKEHYFMFGTKDVETSQIISQFIRQYYGDSSFIPKEILLCDSVEDEEILKTWLSSKALHSVSFKIPKIGKNAELMKMITLNAKKEHSEYILKRMKDSDYVNNALSELMSYTNLDSPPMLIEAYDVSNISGSANVGSLITFKDGKPFKSGYKNFKIKSVEGQNDYASMHEMIKRRFDRYKQYIKSNVENSFSVLPDLILVDGGYQHVLIACSALEEADISVPVFGIVKDDKHNTRGLVSSSGDVYIDPGSNAFILLTNIQDEMHRRAITYHRKLRDVQLVESKLTDIPGVGEAKKKILISKFKSVSGIKKASLDDIKNTKGIDVTTAKNINDYFNGVDIK